MVWYLKLSIAKESFAFAVYGFSIYLSKFFIIIIL